MSTPNIINIIFSAGRGDCDTRTKEATTGEPYGDLPVARRSGYTFEGWFTQPDVNGDKVVPSDTVTTEQDITLYAHFTKAKGVKKKKSSYRLQKAVLIALIATIVVLSVALVAVNYLVSIIPYTDYNGEQYRAKKSDGIYSLYDEDGIEVPKNSDGYYLTDLGTQLSVDPDTGAITEYAVVDTEGREAVGANSRILMFAQIRQADIDKIEVENRYGSFTFYHDKDGNVQIKGFETDKVLVAYDKEKYAYLCVGAGYPLTIRKLDTAEVLKRGYAEYGLVAETRVDEEGNEYDYKPTRYTVTSTAGVSHTVLIGDPIISEAGYYVKLEGDDYPSVYIMGNSTYESALLCRVEDLITPMLTYPTTLNNCFNVENFVLATYEDDNTSPNIDVAFDYIDLTARENSMYSTEPYQANEGGGYKYSGYRLNGTELSNVTQNLYQPNITRICELGLTKDVLTEYGLDQPRHILYYDLRLDTDEDGTFDSTVQNSLLISDKTAQGTYYVASYLCDVVAEVDQSTLYFLEYGAIDWVNANIIWINLAFLRTVEITSPDYSATLTMDNSASDQSSAISSAGITFKINGETPDYVVYKKSYASENITAETPVYNLRQFYKSLLSLTIAGNVSDGHFTLSEEEMAAFRALDDSECQLVIRIDAEDMATTYNAKYYTENNKESVVYRFYRYSEGRSYLTVNGEGEFFVDASYVEKLIADAKRLEEGILIDSTSKT